MQAPNTAEAQALGAADAGVRQFLRLAIGAERYALRIDAVREILQVSKTTPLPRMPDFVCGVMNLRGAVVPVVDLGARLGLGPTAVGRRTCVVIVEVRRSSDGAPARMGVLVDAVFEVVDCAPGEIEPVPRLGTRVHPSFLRSMVRVRGEATAELDLGTLLDQQALAGLIADHVARHGGRG
ncbi:MAG: chemotaxis protein CheW [Leptothrix sp. (in: b-proteobacteria)]